MAARKGIKAKIIERLAAEPDRVWTGREIENMYVEYGGAVNPDVPRIPRRRRNRVSGDTIIRLFGQLPIRRTKMGERGPGGRYAMHYERSEFVYDDGSSRVPANLRTSVPAINP